MSESNHLIPACEFDREGPVLMGLSMSEFMAGTLFSMAITATPALVLALWLGFIAGVLSLMSMTLLITYLLAKIASKNKKGKPHGYYAQKIIKRFKPNYSGYWINNRHV